MTTTTTRGPWPPWQDALLRQEYPRQGPSTALQTALKRTRRAIVGRAYQLGLQAPARRPRQPHGLRNSEGMTYEQRRARAEPDHDERRRARARQLARDVGREGACLIDLCRSDWTEDGITDIVRLCPEWFCGKALRLRGKVILTEAGKALLLPPEGAAPPRQATHAAKMKKALAGRRGGRWS